MPKIAFQLVILSVWAFINLTLVKKYIKIKRITIKNESNQTVELKVGKIIKFRNYNSQILTVRITDLDTNISLGNAAVWEVWN